MLENWKKNMTDWMTELFERKFSSCNKYIEINDISAETLTTGQMIPSGTKSPPAA
jgi:disulfide oxidoreductase YuzD